jgi:4-amino-4-deoxy-L-arabinose transferase-like glycosyltransferase
LENISAPQHGHIAVVQTRQHLTALVGLLLFFWAVSLTNLTIVPQVYEDEPWQASTGWKLATEGVFGSDMFQGWHSMERRYFGYMPLHPLFLAGIYRVAGLGLFQTRFEPVAMGAVTLALTYSLGRRLWNPTIGLLAVALLLLVRLTGLTYIQRSGILLVDMARIARYDMVVPVFGLASLHFYLSARRDPLQRPLFYGLAGASAGLAGLSHLYGAFWIIVLGLLALWDKVGWLRFAALVAGCALTWLPYLLYVLGDVAAWRGQTREYGPRFDLLNPAWYWSNLVRERHRYGPGLGPLDWQYLLRPGFWSALIVLPLSVSALLYRAHSYRDAAARIIVVPIILFPLLFALLLTFKLVNYTVTFIPLVALAAAWGVWALWNHASQAKLRWVQPLLILLGLAVAGEGVSRIVALHTDASKATPYATFIAQVRAPLAPGSTVLGLHHYWLGMEEMDYRAWPVPLWQSDPRFSSPPIALEDALSAIAPDAILIDSRIVEAFVQNGSIGNTVRRWMAQEGYRAIGIVEDSTYGRVEIFGVEP